MKAKYLIIVALVIILGFVVYKMMLYEESIRKERIVEVIIEDETKPLISEFNYDKLKEYALTADYYFMTSGDYFKALSPKIEFGENINKWEKLFLKGINLGAAMPGKFPSEFSLSFDNYLEWFRLIGKMNANVIRIYTILPPEFYEAFAYYNLHNNSRKLYLLHGVWAKEPQQDNYFHQKNIREFKKEIKNVIDLIHGNAVIKPKPGSASGTYVADISNYVIGIVLGREWEPKAVTRTNNINNISNFAGNFISIAGGTTMEVWLAQMMDFTVLYETQTYKAQRPVSFVNWLPLDPMYHSTEIIENKKIREYDNDYESIDTRKFNSSDLFAPGIFASYHVYPYYPDYIYLDERYTNSVNYMGKRDNYFGYLSELKKYHPDIPLVIAEYGLPSSRGNSHYTPFGFNQGGHSEKAQAELSGILTNDIHKTGCAGALYFEWIDEWFKFNWLVMDFEQPQERRKFWHNMENPEQNFGVMAVEGVGKTIDGEYEEWNFKKEKKGIFAISDANAEYFYLLSKVPGLNFAKHKLYIAIDTYDKDKGDYKLPFLDQEIDNGIEFLLVFDSIENACILVDDKYSIYTDIYNNEVPGYASVNNSNSSFINQLLISNRPRVTLLGDSIDRIVHNRSILTHGKSNNPKHSNSDWFWNVDKNILELRLTWHLLNVTDPSGRSVLDNVSGTNEIEYSETDGFNIYFFVTDKEDNIISGYNFDNPYFFTWDKWEELKYKTRLKPVYYELQKIFENIEPIIHFEESSDDEKELFKICQYFNNKKGAVSISFKESCYSQFENALPVLSKYSLNATFGVVNDWLTYNPSQIAREGEFGIKRMGVVQLKELINHGHTIAIQSLPNSFTGLNINSIIQEFKSQKLYIQQKTGSKVSTVFVPEIANFSVSQLREKTGLLFGIGATANSNNQAKSYTIYNNGNPTINMLDSLLNINRGEWIILQYSHIFRANSKENRLILNQGLETIFSVDQEIFEKQIRLIRNSGYWIAPVSTIGKYIIEKQNSTVSINEYKNLVFLNVINDLNTIEYNQPLTIEYLTNHNKIKVINSASDGIYNARNGRIYFNVYPNREVTIEVLD